MPEDSGTDQQQTQDQTDDTQDQSATDDLGDAGKKALEVERAARKESDRRYKALEKEVEKGRQSSMTEHEKAVAAARAEGAADERAKSHTQLVGAEARALAATAKFRNPALAVRSIDLVGIKVDDKGDVDGAAITALLTKLAKDEPYLIDSGNGKPKVDQSQGQATGKTSKADDGRAEALKRFGKPAGAQ